MRSFGRSLCGALVELYAESWQSSLQSFEGTLYLVFLNYFWSSNHINGHNRGIKDEFVYKMTPFIKHVCKGFKYRLKLCIKKKGNNNFFG